MARLDFGYEKGTTRDGTPATTLPRPQFASFGAALLGLGRISAETDRQDALAAVFDLEGFTTFCNHADSHLFIPNYLERFLTWLFEQISKDLTIELGDERVYLWGRLPFFSKFMGDGVLFLWDTRGLAQHDIGNIIVTLRRVCGLYPEFLREARKAFSKPPVRLRCGVARGQVMSVGDEADFVGSCINLASRLQKIGGLSFCVSRQGIDPDLCFSQDWEEVFVLRKVAIRGVGDDESVIVSRDELEQLKGPDAEMFRS